jgi:hypothetical protein
MWKFITCGGACRTLVLKRVELTLGNVTLRLQPVLSDSRSTQGI